MMTPEMMSMAQNMMSDMTPEQMESMQKMAASMGGGMGMPPGAAEQMANLTPEEMKAQMDQLKNMDSSSMQSQFKEQQRMMSQQQDYKFGAAKMQKVEGNKLVKAGDFVQAVEKYELARRNLTGNRGTEAADVRQACTLNLALAHLKLKQWDKAIEVAGEGIAAQKDCLKGFYRRGLAYQGKGELQKAAADLRRAAEINPGDQSVEGCLVEVRAALDSAGQAEDTSVEAVVPEAPKVAAHGMPGMDADMMKQATEAFKANPGMAKMAAEQMASMDDEQLAKLSEQMASTGMPAGMPKLTPDMAKSEEYEAGASNVLIFTEQGRAGRRARHPCICRGRPSVPRAASTRRLPEAPPRASLVCGRRRCARRGTAAAPRRQPWGARRRHPPPPRRHPPQRQRWRPQGCAGWLPPGSRAPLPAHSPQQGTYASHLPPPQGHRRP